MTYELEVIENPDYLRLELTGILTKDGGKELVDEVAAALLGSEHELILIDVRKLDLETSLIQDHQQASYAASKFSGKRHKIAQLTSETNLKADEFFETVGYNRGLNSRTFTVESDAIDWLVKE